MVTEFGDEEIAHEAIQADHEDVVRTGRKPNRPVLHSASVPLRSHPKSIQCSERAILSDETEFGLRVEEGERNSPSATNSGPLARLLHLCDRWNGGCCRFLGESLPLTQTFLESLYQVDHWCGFRLRRNRHFLSLQLRFDQSLLPFLEPIVILLEVKGRGKTVDQLSGQHFLLFFQLDLVGLAVLGHLADLVHVEHRVQGEAVGARPDDHPVLALVHTDHGYRRVTRFFHRVEQEPVGFLSGLFRRSKIRSIKNQWIDLLQLHELQDLHRAVRRRRNLLQLLIGEKHVLILFVFVALHDFRALDHTIAVRTEQRLAQARMALFVELVKADALAAGSRKQIDRYGNQPEREMSLPDSRSHDDIPFTRKCPRWESVA